MLIDSHCHLDLLDLTKYNGDLHLALAVAAEQDVQHFLCPGVDLEHFPNILKLAQENKNIFASVALHPSEEVQYDLQEQELLKLADNPLVVAIGETGLDYYYASNEEEHVMQRKRFVTHIRVARELHKSLIIHSRSAPEDIVNILRAEHAEDIGGVMHCFVDDWQTAQQVLAMGFYISFSGIITFKNAADLREVAIQVPLNKMLLETDAPYLAPVPYRGKPNEPAYLRNTAEFMANLRGISYNELAEITTENFFSLFVG